MPPHLALRAATRWGLLLCAAAVAQTAVAAPDHAAHATAPKVTAMPVAGALRDAPAAAERTQTVRPQSIAVAATPADGSANSGGTGSGESSLLALGAALVGLLGLVARRRMRR